MSGWEIAFVGFSIVWLLAADDKRAPAMFVGVMALLIFAGPLMGPLG